MSDTEDMSWPDTVHCNTQYTVLTLYHSVLHYFFFFAMAQLVGAGSLVIGNPAIRNDIITSSSP